MSPLTKSAHKAASRRTGARTLPNPRKAKPARAALVAIVNTAPPVSAFESRLRQSMAADFEREFQAAGLPMTGDFAMELATEAAGLIAAVGLNLDAELPRLKDVHRQVTAIQGRNSITALSRLIEERRAIRNALNLTAGNDALISALEERSRELDDLIVNSPAWTGSELAAKLNMAIDALNEGEGADSVLPILNSCRFDSYSFAVAAPS